MDRLARYGKHTVQYEEGLAVARRIRASRYLGQTAQFSPHTTELTMQLDPRCYTECSAKHNRGVTEVFYESARVSISARSKGSGGSYDRGGCVLM